MKSLEVLLAAAYVVSITVLIVVLAALVLR